MKPIALYNSLKIFAACLIVVTFTACDDFLTILPTDQITEEDFFESKNDLDNVRAAAYQKMTSSTITSDIIIWGELRSDSFTLSDMTNTDLYYVMNGILKETNSAFDWSIFYTVINYCNKVLEKGQEMIDNEVDLSFTNGEWQTLKAEMLGLRALCYFYLVRAFRNVPFVTTSISTDYEALYESQVPATRGEVILGTLLEGDEEAGIDGLEAYANLAATNLGTTADNKGRFTRVGVHCLMADMYLWRGCMLQDHFNKGGTTLLTSDVAEGDSIENTTTYYTVDGTEITEDYVATIADSCFTMSAEHAQWVIDYLYEQYEKYVEDYNVTPSDYLDVSKFPYPLTSIQQRSVNGVQDNVYANIFGNGNSLYESCFEIQYSAADDNDNSTLRSYFSGTSDGANSALALNSSLFNSISDGVDPETGFGMTDIRACESAMIDQASIASYIVAKGVATSVQINNLEDMGGDFANYNDWGTSSNYSNWPVYRISDAMLIKAEALMRSSSYADNYVEACTLMNALFTRCNPGLTTKTDLTSSRFQSTSATYSTREDCIQAIYRERQREFLAEGKRWFDIVRWAEYDNSPKDAITSLGLATSVTNRLSTLNHMYCPIYESNINTNDAENGGYLEQNPAWK